jgi:hypothetical protein
LDTGGRSCSIFGPLLVAFAVWYIARRFRALRVLPSSPQLDPGTDPQGDKSAGIARHTTGKVRLTSWRRGVFRLWILMIVVWGAVVLPFLNGPRGLRFFGMEWSYLAAATILPTLVLCITLLVLFLARWTLQGFRFERVD